MYLLQLHIYNSLEFVLFVAFPGYAGPQHRDIRPDGDGVTWKGSQNVKNYKKFIFF